MSQVLPGTGSCSYTRHNACTCYPDDSCSYSHHNACTCFPDDSCSYSRHNAYTCFPDDSCSYSRHNAYTCFPDDSSTPATTPAPASPTTPAATPATTPAPASPTTPAATPATTPAPASPTTPAATPATTPAPASPTTPAATPATTPAPASPTTPAATPATTPAPASPTTPAATPATTPAPASPTTSDPNPNTKGPCQTNSCGGGSSCINLHTSHFCLCIDGYYYKNTKCNKGKVFPGTIQVKVTDTSGLDNENSITYEELHVKVVSFFENTFKASDYGQTVIQKARISASARSEMRAGDKAVDVAVVNIFAEGTKQNETTVLTAINEAINGSTDITKYTTQDLCDYYGCEKKNEQDDCSNGIQCKCKPGLGRPNAQVAFCVPLSPECPPACDAKHNMQCLVKDDGNSDCVCLAGYKKDDGGKCQACAFGYQGVNCEDNFQLILTVVGTIAGILILGMVIAVIFMRSKKTKDIEEQNLIENDFQNLRLQQTTGFSSPAQRSIFPKITSTVPRDGGMQNPYANPRSIPRPDY
ncbi:mucin-13 [Pteronotus mesoamericanus]|uniref:mucin-13 n=1 Tax=Pteronotus mesoamericanus TaxID=1884717 RepID=UPI0023EBB61F|nr:mucin-13 [Pteronotus parnellii mesoamericanus]